ncbi:hypothetical protein [Acidovorax sp. CCYZU-2555]|uniref:hypothetical protein n=1 Tax=Acidovorax sp. CCYZU-2555 TaxID=2835042 RepID=UPI001BCAB5BA|nr:hypothetical protein [Acidovorax sp. CCYZU-2555]MBS7778563.1 hypothetical protein [Acidovorax sp. CCYZU-2555]
MAFEFLLVKENYKKRRDGKIETPFTTGVPVPLDIKNATDILAEVHQTLHDDRSIDGQHGNVPYLSINALPPGQPSGTANWDLLISGDCSQAMEQAIQRAKVAVQSRMSLLQPFLGSTTFAG